MVGHWCGSGGSGRQTGCELEMSLNVRVETLIDVDKQRERRREERDAMLAAIANAIAVGKLPPDDAWAWARIAASSTELLDAAHEMRSCFESHCS
jgi:hypothetical protein